MDQATIDQDKANLQEAQANVEQWTNSVLAITAKLAADEKEFAKVSVMQELENHAQTLSQEAADSFRSIMSRLSALL
jgi:hypothetical protein